MVSFLEFNETLPHWFNFNGGVVDSDLKELQTIRQFSSTVEGWLSEEQGIALYQLARNSLPGEVLEIGSFCGKSTMFIALGCKQSGTVAYAVDPHKAISEGGKEQYSQNFSPRTKGTFEDFQSNIRKSGLVAFVNPIVCTSEEARSQLGSRNLKLLFIDGSHDYLDVLLDYYLWHDQVVPGGYIVFHDSNFEDVNLMLQKHLDLKRYSLQGVIGKGGSAMTIWQRTEASPTCFLKNPGTQLILDVAGGQTNPGNKVWGYFYNGSHGQQWEIKTDGIIKSKLGNIALDLQDVPGVDYLKTVVVNPINSSATQKWEITNNGVIKNKSNNYTLVMASDKDYKIAVACPINEINPKNHEVWKMIYV